MGQAQAHDRVAGLQQRVVDGGVGLRAGVRLDVGVLGAEQRLGAVDGELLDDVDVLAAAVVALARVALGVLVGEDGALRLEDRLRDEVLRRDHLQRRLLAAQLGVHRLGDLGVDLVEGALEEVRRQLGAHASKILATSAAVTAPSRKMRQPSPVRSTTVDGVPGNRPAPSLRRTPLAISAGTSSRRERVRPAGEVGARLQHGDLRARQRRIGGKPDPEHVRRRPAREREQPVGIRHEHGHGAGQQPQRALRHRRQPGQVEEHHRGGLVRRAALERVELAPPRPGSRRRRPARRPCRPGTAPPRRTGCRPRTRPSSSPHSYPIAAGEVADELDG